jgi:hypothetical protein
LLVLVVWFNTFKHSLDRPLYKFGFGNELLDKMVLWIKEELHLS